MGGQATALAGALGKGGTIAAQAALHGVKSGVIAMAQGGKFGSSFVGGAPPLVRE